MITLNVIGLNETLAKLGQLPKVIEQKVGATLESGAQLFVRNAKRDVAVRYGVTRNLISYFKENPLAFQVVSAGKASPYLEWGTITHVSVPSELAEYAIQFKGKGIRKTGGIYPRPFFFRQRPIVEKYLNEAIPKVLDQIKL